MQRKRSGRGQTELPFQPAIRRKPGRPKSADSGVSHLKRPAVQGKHPVYVTLALRHELPSLRAGRNAEVVLAAVRSGSRGLEHPHGGLRLLHTALEAHRLHLIVEADGTDALVRGIQGLSVRLAKGLNRALGRKGKVLADRYESRALATPAELHKVLDGVFRE